MYDLLKLFTFEKSTEFVVSWSWFNKDYLS